jgi:transcription-repair coupling factor (superfamily II helicase)
MLEEAVARQKGGGEPPRAETEINLGLPARIPDAYIADARDRLKYYKMLSSASDAVARQEAERDMRDRFGPFPEEVETFLAVLAFKERVNALSIARADLFPERLRVTWVDGQRQVEVESLVRLVTANTGRARMFPPATLEIRLDETLALPSRLDEAGLLLGSLASPRNAGRGNSP